MTFEFIISCHAMSPTDLHRMLVDLLIGILEDNSNELDADNIKRMIKIHDYYPTLTVDNDMEIHGFALELPEEIESAEAVVQEFANALPDTLLIFHAVKFEDPFLQDRLATRAKEIFALEMKLRRVLSLIYLVAYQSESPFDLLRKDAVQPTEKLDPKQMRAVSGNQFFHLNFGQYAQLNQRKKIETRDLLDIIQDAEKYDAFRAEVLRTPVTNERDREFIGNLREIMDPIEKMRNCVAHNRQPTDRINENYLNARSRLVELLDEYLLDLEIPF